MSNVQIPSLPAATSLNGTEQLEIVQAGTSVPYPDDGNVYEWDEATLFLVRVS